MGLRDFFRAKRIQKFSKPSASAGTVLSDEEISRNWVTCKECGATIHKAEYGQALNVCSHCGFHGRLSLNARINALVDKDSFRELCAAMVAGDPLKFNDGKPYPEVLKAAQFKTGFKEAMTCGTARIEGIEVVLAVMNFDFIGGSMGTVVGEKFTQAVELAISQKIPFISVSSSGGARMHEGILSLMQMAKTSIALARLSEQAIPFFSILTDPTFGGVAASFASLGDLIIAEPKARIGFAGRRVIEETVKEKLPDDFQTAEYLLEHGQIDLIIHRKDLKAKLAQILRMHGYFSADFSVADTVISARSSQKAPEQPAKQVLLDFEKPLASIQEQIQALESKIKTPEEQDLLSTLKRNYIEVESKLYNNLSAIDITKIARHPYRPNIEDYLRLMCADAKYIELHGDRAGTDDQAIMCALVELEGISFMAIGTRKGRNIKDNQKRNFGMPQPEGYRKAKRFFEYASKFNLPIVTFIDTPGAYPGLNAEANGQSIAIAENLKTLANLEVPVLAIITGEGGSGGALAIGLANKVLMLENSVYSVISPEGCAAILWRTRDKAAEAAEALKITAKDLYKLSVIDEIIPEPLGGAHKDWNQISTNIQEALLSSIKELQKYNHKQLKEQRKQKFYNFGKIEDPILDAIS
jgi:acetyl-CoA carboxylase carboxyl transferase subunit beta